MLIKRLFLAFTFLFNNLYRSYLIKTIIFFIKNIADLNLKIVVWVNKNLRIFVKLKTIKFFIIFYKGN
jgi:hypothetical protein